MGQALLLAALDGPAPDHLWPDGHGGVIAACRSGAIFVIGREGRPSGRDDLETAITALVRPGDHRADAPPAIGTADGRVLVFPQD
ncbi:MAG TPA: hypothetical protein VMY37_12750 [Thermoguttaceae bacterium]|nr:hypothetical protein [Thermoguttaceae bacterium]